MSVFCLLTFLGSVVWRLDMDTKGFSHSVFGKCPSHSRYVRNSHTKVSYDVHATSKLFGEQGSTCVNKCMTPWPREAWGYGVRSPGASSTLRFVFFHKRIGCTFAIRQLLQYWTENMKLSLKVVLLPRSICQPAKSEVVSYMTTVSVLRCNNSCLNCCHSLFWRCLHDGNSVFWISCLNRNNAHKNIEELFSTRCGFAP